MLRRTLIALCLFAAAVALCAAVIARWDGTEGLPSQLRVLTGGPDAGGELQTDDLPRDLRLRRTSVPGLVHVVEGNSLRGYIRREWPSLGNALGLVSIYYTKSTDGIFVRATDDEVVAILEAELRSLESSLDRERARTEALGWGTPSEEALRRRANQMLRGDDPRWRRIGREWLEDHPE